jgi:histone H3/H4
LRLLVVGNAFTVSFQEKQMSDQEILVVQSKIKAYIKAKSGMSTSGAVAGRLSELIRSICDNAIAAAAKDRRKTVMDRDLGCCIHDEG